MKMILRSEIFNGFCRGLRKTGIVFLAAAFFSSGVLSSLGIAAVQNISGPRESTSLDDQFLVLDVGTFTLPTHLGEVRFSHKGNSNRIVIHIQDAHCNYFAQTKISDIIDYLNKEYGIHMLNVEGGAGGYDLSAFTKISGEEIRREVSEYFVKRGEVNGAELYAINNPEAVELWGIEDKDLYLKNLKVYRDSLFYKDEIEEYLKELRHIFNDLKTRIYPAGLLKIDMAYNAYKAGNLDFKDYLDFLIDEAKAQGISVKKYPNLYLISQAMEKEPSVDFKRANKERSVLVDKMKGVLSKNEMGELVSKTVDFKTKRIPVKDFYNYLLGKARECGLKSSEYPALSGYIVYVSLFEAVDSFYVMEELDKLEAEIKEPLYLKDSERELNLLSRNLALMGNIFGLVLTKNDFAYYRDNKDSFRIRKFLDFIENEAPACGITTRASEGVVAIDDYLSDITGFYEISFERDEAFIRNMRFSFSPSGTEAALIMTGGFHTENLAELFRREGYSYVSIMPKFTSEEGYDSPYFAILSGQTADIQQMLRSALAESAMLQVVSLLNNDPSLADVFYGDDGAVNNFRTAVAIIAFLREKGYSLDTMDISWMRMENGVDLSVGIVSEKGSARVEIPAYVLKKAIGIIDRDQIAVLEEALDVSCFTRASPGAMTEKKAVHECIKRLEDGKTLVMVTAETSNLSDLNMQWKHMGVDAVRDAFGEAMYRVLSPDVETDDTEIIDIKKGLGGAGAEFFSHTNPYGGRWHFAFVAREGYKEGEFAGIIDRAYAKAKEMMVDDETIGRRGEMKDILEGAGKDAEGRPARPLDPFNVVFGVSSGINISSMETFPKDYENGHEDLWRSYRNWKERSSEELSKEENEEMGEVYKYLVKVLYGNSLRGILYAENEFYKESAPWLLSRGLREELGGGVAINNVFSSGKGADGLRRVFVSNQGIKDWYRDKWTSGWGKYDVFRFKVPNFTLIEAILDEMNGWQGPGALTRRSAENIIERNMFLQHPEIKTVDALVDYIMELAVLSHDGIPQGRQVINSLMQEYATGVTGTIFRINLDFDRLSQAPVKLGNIVNSEGVKLIEKAFSEELGSAVTLRSGSGDEMVVVGRWASSDEGTLEEAIRRTVEKINNKYLPGLKDANGNSIAWKWGLSEGAEDPNSPSISAGVSMFNLGQGDINRELRFMDSKSETAVELAKSSGRKGVRFYNDDMLKRGEELDEEDVSRTLPPELSDIVVDTVRGVYSSRSLKDPFSAESPVLDNARAPPESIGMSDDVVSAISGLMGNIRSHNHPNVHLIGLTKEEFEIEQSYVQKLRGETKRYYARQVGNSNYYQIFYNMESANISDGIKAAIGSLPPDIKNGLETCFVASGNEGFGKMVRGIFEAQGTIGGKYLGMTEGDFSPSEGAENQRYSHVTLAFYGLGLMEWDRRAEGPSKTAIAESLKTLLERMVDNFEEVADMDSEDIITKVLAGSFKMRIKKIDFEDIKTFMESERAILRSL